MTIIDLWRVSEDISKLRTYKLYEGGQTLVTVEDILAVLKRHTKEIRHEKDKGIHIREDNRNK